MSQHLDTPHHLGSRHDPHAQARQSRAQPLLLHSLALFREIFEIIAQQQPIKTVIEVGVESGEVSAMYADLGASAVYCVDPHPDQEVRTKLAENEALHLVEKASPEALDELPIADLYVLDGDHNYATVSREVSWILAHAPDAVLVVHDLMWPCSRRDLYYSPSQLSVADRHADSADGPTIWHDELTPAGFVGHGAFTTASHAGGERNGVLTAVEDTLAEAAEQWCLELIPAVFGLGILIRQASPAASPLISHLRPYSQSRLLAAMENNRIALYTRVLQRQYEATAHAGTTDQAADLISHQTAEIDRLESDLATRTAQQAECARPEKPNEPQGTAEARRPETGGESIDRATVVKNVAYIVGTLLWRALSQGRRP